MLHRMILLIAGCALALAACAPAAEEPADTSPAPAEAEATEDAAADTPEPFVIVTRGPETPVATGEQALEIPGRGTLVAPETEDPNAGQMFDYVRVTRYGGPEYAERIEIELRPDGSYVRNGEAGRISPDRVAELNALLNEINFFGIQANMMGPSAEDTAFRYTLTVRRGVQERTILSQDQYMPQEYIRLLVNFFDIGVA